MILLEDVKMTYSSSSGKTNDALNGVSLHIEKGEFVFIVGESGSGKSTLIKLLLRELKPTSGKIVVNKFDLTRLRHRMIPKYRRCVGVIFQDFRLLMDRSVYENIAFAQHVIGKSKREIRKNVPHSLSLVGLAEKYRNMPNELSGGEKQRVAIARALVNNPPILLADEPTGNLDPSNTWEVMELLDQINKRGTTVVVVTHNSEVVNAMHKRVITMRRGVIVSDEKGGNYLEEV